MTFKLTRKIWNIKQEKYMIFILKRFSCPPQQFPYNIDIRNPNKNYSDLMLNDIIKYIIDSIKLKTPIIAIKIKSYTIIFKNYYT